MPRYKVLRYFADPELPPVVVKTGLSLDEAQDHCNLANSSSRTCTDELGQARTARYGAWHDEWKEQR